MRWAERWVIAWRPLLEKCRDVAPAELRSGQTQGFAAKQRHGLGFHFSDIAWRCLCVWQVALVAVKAGVGEQFGSRQDARPLGTDLQSYDMSL